jgi:hypothetical protein
MTQSNRHSNYSTKKSPTSLNQNLPTLQLLPRAVVPPLKRNELSLLHFPLHRASTSHYWRKQQCQTKRSRRTNRFIPQAINTNVKSFAQALLAICNEGTLQQSETGSGASAISSPGKSTIQTVREQELEEDVALLTKAASVWETAYTTQQRAFENQISKKIREMEEEFQHLGSSMDNNPDSTYQSPCHKKRHGESRTLRAEALLREASNGRIWRVQKVATAQELIGWHISSRDASQKNGGSCKTSTRKRTISTPRKKWSLMADQSHSTQLSKSGTNSGT